jgi:xanthine dehydrogenase YagT iron-sulfur-binding subunit
MAPHDPPDSVSRRDFFKTLGVGSMATTVLGGEGADAAAEVVGPGAVSVRLTVNGRARTLDIEPRVTLLDAVRDYAGLTGNKRVCDRGTCGACTMIVDDRAVYGCSILAIDVQGKRIRTVDGLASADGLHPVQAAFCAADALMCGFCTPGFVMATVALLEKYPNATAEQARRGLDGNVCRCGTFKGIFEAAMSARRPRAANDGHVGDAVAAAVVEGEVTRG